MKGTIKYELYWTFIDNQKSTHRAVRQKRAAKLNCDVERREDTDGISPASQRDRSWRLSRLTRLANAVTLFVTGPFLALLDLGASLL